MANNDVTTERAPLPFSGKHSWGTLYLYVDSGTLLEPPRLWNGEQVAKSVFNQDYPAYVAMKRITRRLASVAGIGQALRLSDSIGVTQRRVARIGESLAHIPKAEDRFEFDDRPIVRHPSVTVADRLEKVQKELASAHEPKWHEKPLGLLLIGATTAVIGGILSGLAVYYLTR